MDRKFVINLDERTWAANDEASTVNKHYFSLLVGFWFVFLEDNISVYW